MSSKTSKPAALEVMRCLWALAHALEARSKRMHRKLGITGPQRLVLRAVGELPDCSPGDVARHLHLHPGTVSRHVSSLVRSGHLRRTMDRGDGRKQRLALSRKGAVLGKDHRGTIEEAVRSAIGSAPASDVKAMLRLVMRLTDDLSD